MAGHEDYAAPGVPTGLILAWSGAIADIPSGWALCDGTGGTPDLRDKFVVGAGGSYAPGDTGGEVSHTLTVNEIPSHNHDLTTYASLGSGAPPAVLGVWVQTQAANTGNTGGGAAHENRPPYYALAFIMKT